MGKGKKGQARKHRHSPDKKHKKEKKNNIIDESSNDYHTNKEEPDNENADVDTNVDINVDVNSLDHHMVIQPAMNRPLPQFAYSGIEIKDDVLADAEKRRRELYDIVEILNIRNLINQCGPNADPLFAKYLFDISCLTLNSLSNLGVTLKDLLKLQALIPVIYPWDEGYDKYRQDYNRYFNIFPWMIVMANTKKDVKIAFNWAKHNKVPLCMRSGGHSYEAFSLCNGMVIDQSRRKEIKVNPKHNTAKVSSGVLIGPLSYELAKYNLALPAGTCPNVGVTGLTLGGGLGFLTRKYGLTCDNLLELKIITADGKTRTANREKNPDLFWANRGGGGGNFGIVLSLKYQVHYIPKVVLYRIVYDFDQIDHIIDKWQHWAPKQVDELSSELSISNNQIVVDGEYDFGKCRTSEEAEKKLYEILTPILTIPTASVRIWTVPYVDAVRFFSQIVRRLPYHKQKSDFIQHKFSSKAIDVIKHYMGSGKPPVGSVSILFDAWGGAVSRIGKYETAFPNREGTLFWFQYSAYWYDVYQANLMIDWITEFYNEMRPFASGQCYVNCPDLQVRDYLHAYYNSNLDRLIRVKTKYDPDNIFNFPQSIPTLSSLHD